MCCWKVVPLAALGAVLCGAETRVLFSPFPSDTYTAADPGQKTGRRVNLPAPEACAASPALCAGLQLVNRLDGFHVNPRIEVRFSGAVDAESLREGVRLAALENLTAEEHGLHSPGEIVPLNRLSYDPAAHAFFAKPDNILDQHRRYALVVTDAVRDAAGAPVGADPAFTACLASPEGYCAELRGAVESVRSQFAPRRIVGASVFTTLSVTAWLEAARRRLGEVAPEAAPAGPASAFDFAQLSGVTLRLQTGVEPARFREETLPVALLNLIPAGVPNPIGRIVFGTFASPRFLGPHFEIEPQPAASAAAPPALVERVGLHALLPSRPRPAAGYPVVIFGHGFTDSRFGGPSAVAPVFTAAGFAVAAINAFGHGYGPASSIVLTRYNGARSELSAGGRGVDFDGDGRIGDSEGCLILSIEQPIALRDCLRQTAVDLMQLVRVIRAGVDLDQDGRPDFDPGRIYYAGMSLGAIYGTMLAAVEPGIRAFALNVGGGTVVEIARASESYRRDMTLLLAQLGLLNASGDFIDEAPGRHEAVRILGAGGAAAVQEALERMEWLQACGDPLFYAPHLRSSTLPGVGIRNVLWQMAKGDRTVPLTTQAALVRAANMRESSWLFRSDVARAVFPQLPENPHAFLANLLSLPAIPVALAAQRQMAVFFETGEAPDPNPAVRPLYGRDLFEIPAAFSEELNY